MMMKKFTFLLALAVMFGIGCSNEAKKEAGRDSTETAAINPPDSAAMMKAWTDYMTPGEMHAMLAKSNGTWDEEVSHWMSPDAPPTVEKMVCVNKMILGGRYQQSMHTGSFEGMPFEGISTVAFDNIKKKYISTWIDNFGTGVMYLEGSYDPATQTLTSTGKCVDPATKAEMTIKETMKFVDDNTQMIEMFDTRDGKEVKTMAMKLTRRK